MTGLGKRVFVAGHRGMVGAALVRRLVPENCEILLADRAELDLLDQAAVHRWFIRERPDTVIVAAAKVGGILANHSYPADFIYQNIQIVANIIHAAHLADVNRLLNLGSSCIYPKFAHQPIIEEALLTGALESTNEWYAVAKIAGLKLAEAYRRQYSRDYISGMPTNLYGPGDNYDLMSSHVMPALIHKAHLAKKNGEENLVIWGTGKPRREFLHVDDCADACVFLLHNYSDAIHINIGAGSDIAIAELAMIISEIIGYKGSIVFDISKPDGTPRKLMSNARLTAMGWNHSISLGEGIVSAYADFLDRY